MKPEKKKKAEIAKDETSLPMKIRELIKLVEKDGWYLIRTRGSHRQFHHPTKPGTVTIAGNLGEDATPGMHNSVLKQARLKN